MYNKRTWLNTDDSHFTSSIACFHGKRLFGKETLEDAFIEITDCYHKIRLHIGDEYDYDAYVDKIDKLIDELTQYRDYIKLINIYNKKRKLKKNDERNIDS